MRQTRLLPGKLPLPLLERLLNKYTSKKDGVIKEISNRAISKTARVAGAHQDKGAGIYLRKHVGDKVKKGEALFTIYAPNKDKLDYVKDVIKAVDGVVIR